VSWEKRDYYRVEDDHGSRFWIFREMKSPSRSSALTRWFLQGYLP
jgi:protein ImuB